ncbi:MAG: toxin-antitoxin system HicB family antitoxin [Clostridia bacterium]|nr:toxin-antitoxin system HicB family antitoxin [Clostridia bacterium]
MAQKKSFLLRLDPELHEAIARWAADDLRSVNGQIEYLLREALRKAGRLPHRGVDDVPAGEERGSRR